MRTGKCSPRSFLSLPLVWLLASWSVAPAVVAEDRPRPVEPLANAPQILLARHQQPSPLTPT